MKRFSKEIEMIMRADTLSIYGAGDVAREVAFCLRSKPFCKKIDAFVVSGEPERSELCGAPVISISSGCVKNDGLIIIATLEKYRDEIVSALERIGAQHYLAMTFESDLWCEVRKGTFAASHNMTMLEDAVFAGSGSRDHSDIKVYVVKSAFDKPLCEQWVNRDWEQDIHVGAALTDCEICHVKDDFGDHISYKNRKYCELTALYWIWKNTDDAYAGLCHYRRHFTESDAMIYALASGEVDVVITVPMVNIPSVEAMYKKNHDIEDWKVAKSALVDLAPEYVHAFEEVAHGTFYVAYNMFIMKREWLNRYCAWLFPILADCEEKIGDKEDAYQNRYIGFLGERLLTVFLHYHRDEMKIVYADKHFLE